MADGEASPSRNADARCRICAQPAGADRGPLLIPCCCVGTARYVHSSCLNKQRLRDGLLAESFWECTVCGAAYRMKPYGQVLSWLTTRPAVAILSVICCSLVMGVASEIFRVSSPFLGSVIIKMKDASPGPFVLQVYIQGVDYGYFLGGLLVITLARKVSDAIVTNTYSDLLSFTFFIPTLLPMANDPQFRSMVLMMFVIYSCFNAGFVITTVFRLMMVLASLVVREQVVDFVGLPEGNDDDSIGESREGVEGVDNQDNVCLCCWDSRAQFAMKGCGHLIACNICRRRLVYRQFRLNAGFAAGSVTRMQLLTAKQLETTKVKCPLCRKIDVMVLV